MVRGMIFENKIDLGIYKGNTEENMSKQPMFDII